MDKPNRNPGYSAGQDFRKEEITGIGLEITTLELDGFEGSADSTRIEQALIEFHISMDSLFEENFIANLAVGSLLGENDIDGCLDGIGQDVAFILHMENGSRPEIFFGCDDYSTGTLRIGNDYSKFWKVAFPEIFQSEI